MAVATKRLKNLGGIPFAHYECMSMRSGRAGGDHYS